MKRWDPSGAVSLPQSTTATTGVVAARNPADGLRYLLGVSAGRLDAVDTGGETVVSYDISSAVLGWAESMSFAPSTDVTDDPEELNLFVTDSSGAVIEVTLEQPPPASTEVVVSADLIRSIDTSDWDPPAIDPSGVVWNPSGKTMVVVDSEVEETGWYDGANLWEVGSASGTVVRAGTTLAYTAEPSGAGYDGATNTFFLSDDDANVVLAVRPGADTLLGTADDSVDEIAPGKLVTSDAEDPEFHSASGDLFVLGGVDREIYRIDPVDGVFGDSNDTVTSFDISHLGPTDFEGLASLPERDTLLVGSHQGPEIFEITMQGTLVRVIDISSSGASSVDGLAWAPSSQDASITSLWVAQRGLDEKNDGMIYELALPAAQPGPAPVANDDQAVTEKGSSVSIEVLANDTDADGDPLSVTDLTGPDHGTVVANPDHTVTYDPDAGYSGTDTFTYRAFDGTVASGAATVTVTVLDDAVEPQDPGGDEPASGSTDWFVDDDEHLFELDINAVATAGITRGCNPPANDRFCPDDPVTRGQMAAFLVRALGLEAGSAGFTDTGGSVFAWDISALATAGITRGCNPPTNDHFCPDDPVTRGQMAAFLARALLYGR